MFSNLVGPRLTHILKEALIKELVKEFFILVMFIVSSRRSEAVRLKSLQQHLWAGF